MNTYRQTLALFGVCAFTVGVAACASSKPPAPSPKPSPSPTVSASAAGQIKANWIKFFDFSTPTAQRIPLLENGSEFSSVLQSQSSPGSMYSSAHATVTSVSDITPTTATVKYNILLGTTPALTNQTGTAVYQDGIWKVGDASLCGLLTLEGLKPLPAACSSAG